MAKKYANFFIARLSSDISASDVEIPITDLPKDDDNNVITEGKLVIDAKRPDKREVIGFTGIDGSKLIGVTRGLGRTLATTHQRNATIEMTVLGSDLTEIYQVADIIDGAPLPANSVNTQAIQDEAVTASKIDMIAEVDTNGWTVFALGPIRIYSKRFTGVTTDSVSPNGQSSTAGGGGNNKAFPVGVAPADANWLADGTTTDGISRWKFFIEGVDMNSTNTANTFTISARNLTTSTISMTGGVVSIVGVGFAT